MADVVTDCDSSRRRLLLVSPSAELYGADRMILAVMPALVEQFDVTMCVPTSGPLIEDVEALGASVVELPDYAIRSRFLHPMAIWSWFARIIRSVVALTRLHRRHRFDIVYSVTLAAGIGAVATLWRRPHVQHIHEVVYQGGRREQLLLRWVSMTAQRVLCNSTFTQDRVVTAVPKLADRTVVARNGLEFPAATAPRIPTTDGPLRVGCVARINRIKGQAVLAEAAARAVRDGSDWELHFFGDTTPGEEFMEDALRVHIAESGLESRTTFHGFVEDQDAIYAAMDVLVIPTTIPEAFGLTALEAQARGIPVVATVPGGPAEVVSDGETGFLVPAGDPDALQVAIRRLEVPELRERMGHTAAAMVRERFSVDRMRNEVVAVLDECVYGSPSP